MDKKRVALIALALGKQLLEGIHSDSESESDNEMEITLILETESKLQPRKKINPRCKDYFEEVIPRYSFKEFQMNFRMTPEAFQVLCQKIVPILENNYRTGHPLKNVEKQILGVIWLLATPDSYRSVGSQFNFEKSSLSDAFFRIIPAINQLGSQIIKWPRGEVVERIKNEFRSFAALQNVIGAVDGTYVPIKAPKEDSEVFNTRKCFYAYTLQCIAEPSLKFTDSFIGYPGSVSDRRIFSQSYIYKNIEENVEGYFNNEDFILGDKAYPLKTWCIPPYLENRRLTAAETHFNISHAKTRQVIERALGLLFGRFRRLKYLDMVKTDFIPAVVLACCILHNICLDHADLFTGEYVAEERANVQNEDLEYQMVDRHANRDQNAAAQLKRSLICSNLYEERQIN